MGRYLVSFTYHTAHDWAIAEMTSDEMHERSAALFIEAASEADALQWGGEVASLLMDYLGGDAVERWSESGHSCWIESDPSQSRWADALGFVQTVRNGEIPNYDRMTEDAYMDWLESDGTYES